MFGWLKFAAISASLRNISTNSRSSARCGRMRLTTRFLAKPSMPDWRARHTSALPPVPRFFRSWYLPKGWGWEGGFGFIPGRTPGEHAQVAGVSRNHLRRASVPWQRRLGALGALAFCVTLLAGVTATAEDTPVFKQPDRILVERRNHVLELAWSD